MAHGFHATKEQEGIKFDIDYHIIRISFDVASSSTLYDNRAPNMTLERNLKQYFLRDLLNI